MQVNALSGSDSGATLLQVGARTTRSTNLAIVTAEGDRITLSASSTRAFGCAAVGAGTADARVSAEALQVTGSDQVSLSVEGNLSHAEIVDIQKIVKAFEKAAARGDASRLLDRLSRPDLDTVASVSGSATTTTDVSAAVVSAALYA